jgi:hypothetical protein
MPLAITIFAITLMMALASALALLSQTETLLGASYRDGVESGYVAAAGVERAIDDLMTVGDWNEVLASTDGLRAIRTSSCSGGALSVSLPDGRSLDLGAVTNRLNCGASTSCSASELDAVTSRRPWGRNNPRFRLFAWCPASGLAGTGTVDSAYYVAVWVADDTAEADGDPSIDGGPTEGSGAVNPGAGMVIVHGEAFGPSATHHVIETTILKSSDGPPPAEAGAAVSRVQLLTWRDGR